MQQQYRKAAHHRTGFSLSKPCQRHGSFIPAMPAAVDTLRAYPGHVLPELQDEALQVRAVEWRLRRLLWRLYIMSYYYWLLHELH